MNYKTQKALYGSLIIFLLIVIGTSIYSLLGGFEEVAVRIQPGERLTIVGKYFEGYYAHPDLEELWNRSRELVEEGEIPGILAVVNYDNASLDNDAVAQFIGVAITGGMAEVPPDFEVLEIEPGGVVRVLLAMHPLVRPGPLKVEEMIDKYALDNALTLEGFTVELHFEDNTMSIDAPVASVE